MRRISHLMSARKRGTSFFWHLICFFLFLLLSACSTGQGLSTSSSSGTPGTQSGSAAPSPTSVVTLMPTQQTSPGPSPVAVLLAPAPKHCPTAPSPGSQALSGWTGKLVGTGPVLELGLPPNSTLNLNQLGETPWPLTKIMWPITPNFPSFVVVRVTNLQTGTQAWWDVGQGASLPNEPVRPLVMNQNPNRVSQQSAWGTLLYLPLAGCYAMQVNWPGGQWRLLFAVGR